VQLTLGLIGSDRTAMTVVGDCGLKRTACVVVLAKKTVEDREVEALMAHR